jgi:hypothetical protein
MPLYEYQLLDPGQKVLATAQVPLPVNCRDDDEAIRAILPPSLARIAGLAGVTISRIQVPSSLAIVGSARNPGETANQVLDAYKRIEQRLGNTSEFQRRIGHSPSQVRKAWGNG